MSIKGSTKKICQSCGCEFLGGEDKHYCPDCTDKIKRNVIRERTCKECGKVFYGGPRAMYCPDCREKRRRDANKKYKKNGPQRKLGSIDICERCGKEYIVESGKQRFCKDCARESLLEWQKEHKKKEDKATKNEKRNKLRKDQLKVCEYCGRTFHTDRPTKYCSDHCLTEQRKINQIKADIRRGYHREDALDEAIRKREEYKIKVKETTKN